MSIVHFLEKQIIDSEMEMHYNFITQVKTLTEAHDHDFFEIFLIAYGSTLHCVDDSSFKIQEGTLVFIRPEDVHYYIPEDDSCGIINLAFPKRTLQELFNYLGKGFSPERLLDSKYPPMINLSETEKILVQSKLEKLNILPRDDKQMIRTEVRVLLMELFTKYFSLSRETKSKIIPNWINKLRLEMQEKENFIAGLPKMTALSRKSPEHLCRVFKECFYQTPSQFINDLRLNYAANLLSNSDAAITDICLECGFENLSHFYHQFKRKFSMPPSHFRKLYHKSAIFIN